VILASLVACGTGAGPNVAISDSASESATASTSPTPSPSPTSTAGEWQTYTDPDYRFSIDYPPDFVVEDVTASGTLQGLLKAIRFVDQRFLKGYTPGQAAIHVDKQDAATVNEWVVKHSAPSTAPDNPSIYFRDVTDLREATAADRSAAVFDWNAAEIGLVHVVAFELRKYVITIDWFADEPSYETTIRPIFERMVASYRD
jgi:hypothetical protein